MKTYLIFAAILALAIAKNIETKAEEKIDDAESIDKAIAEQSLELLRTNREAKEDLDTAASDNYVPPSQRPPRPWDNYVPNQFQNYGPNQVQNYIPNGQPPQNYIPNNFQNFQNIGQNPQGYIPSNVGNYFPNNPQGSWTNPQSFIPQNGPATPSNVFNPSYVNNVFPGFPQNDQPQNNPTTSSPPANKPPPQQDAAPPATSQNPQAPQNDYYNPQNTWTTTPVVTVIKNDQYFGQNGDYKYEYQIADGTHVGEEGYLLNPNTENESVVKKGWYSYTGGDGKVYTVTWWADNTGFHAFGDHLPTPPPTPAAIQAALDQAAKEEAEKNKPQYQPTQPPTYYPQPQPTKPTYYPQQTYPQQTYPQQTYPQQTYPQQQQTYYPPSYGK